MSGKLKNIHALRGVASVIVLFFHLGFILPDSLQGYVKSGAIGVNTFFILSGFIIYYATQQNENIITFYMKRFFRIYPVFFVVWLISVIVLFKHVPFIELMKSLLLFHIDYNTSPAPSYGFNLLGTPWTLTYEIFFYGIFGLSMLISHKYRALICSFIIILVVIALQFIYNGTFSVSSQVSASIFVSHWWQVPVKILSTTVLFEFVVGIVIAELYLNTKKIFDKGRCYLFFGAMLLLIGLGFLGRINYMNAGLTGAFWIAFPLFMIFIARDYLNLAFNSRVLTVLGDLSYSLYIIHFPVMLFYRGTDFAKLQFSYLEKTAVFLIMVLLCCLFSAVSYLLIEKPAQKLVRIFLKKQATYSPLQKI